MGLQLAPDGHGALVQDGITYAVLPLRDLVSGSPARLTYAAARCAEEAAREADAL